MRQKLLYINTIGCQMNVYDSERMSESLRAVGYQATPAIDAADLIIANTCAIREKAEQKVFSFLGRLAGLKRKKPGLIIGVGGCVAQQEGGRMLKRVPHLDLVFGTHALSRLPGLVTRVESEGCRLVDVGPAVGIEDPAGRLGTAPADGGVSRFVTIMQGCDNYCTYCVVPYVRGRETSRSPEVIVDEVRHLVDGGVREITLLGQNVNSYGRKEGLCSFAELLARVNAVQGLERIRFTTSHPKDLSATLIQAFAVLEKLCSHIHLPVQSGSDAVLHRMNRKYTRRLYLERVAQLREVCPDIAITSDIIVGFPGESRTDFEETLDLIRTVRYDGLFAFKYSDRPSAPAARFGDKLSETVKQERLARVLELQEAITLEKNRSLIGTVQEVLVEGTSRRAANPADAAAGDGLVARGGDFPGIQWSGRTSSHKIVHFTEPDGTSGGPFTNTIVEGMLIAVRIEKAFAHSLRGEVLTAAGPTPERRKGADFHDA
jgi:tRNA-2-methylthio-N6-dimethylallyladenosine synthase